MNETRACIGMYPLRSHAVTLARLVVLVGIFAIGSALHAQAPLEPSSRNIIASPAWGNPTAALNDLARGRLANHPAKLSNLSVRALAGTGFESLIAGAVVHGEGALPALVRAIGPGLERFNVSNFVRQPILEVYQESRRAAETTVAGPGTAAMAAYLGAFPGVEATGNLAGSDASIGGYAYAGTLTAHCMPANNVPGVGLLEFYDASIDHPNGAARFVNLSARARVESNEAIMVLGFVVAGEGNVRLLLRGVGSTLAGLGVPNGLSDPLIELFAGDTRIAANDNWRSGDASAAIAIEDAQASVRAFPLESANDAALLVTLPAGAYTLQLSGRGAPGGIALAEIHQVTEQPFDAARSLNSVGIDLLRQLAESRASETIILSPYSIESALALVYAGADGDTREEMARVLRLPADNGTLQRGFAGLRRSMEEIAERSKVVAAARSWGSSITDPIQWNAANRLFGQRDFGFRESFLTLMREGFEAPLELLDFIGNPEFARGTINRWVEQETRDKIKDLIPAGGVTGDTRLVLVNALYLKAPWDTAFANYLTAPRPFRSAAGGVRNVATMQRTAYLGYVKEQGMTVVNLDYLGGGLQFIIMLPDEGESVESVARRLTAEHFTRWANLGASSTKYVALSLPKFRVEGSTVPLGPALRALGMTQAFNIPPGSANFDGIAPRRGGQSLAISNVYHQTFIALDEEGTEAAAATAVVTSVASSATITPPPIEVRVDRPFLFAIQHKASGACLFLGRLMNVP